MESSGTLKSKKDVKTTAAHKPREENMDNSRKRTLSKALPDDDRKFGNVKKSRGVVPLWSKTVKPFLSSNSLDGKPARPGIQERPLAKEDLDKEDQTAKLETSSNHKEVKSRSKPTATEREKECRISSAQQETCQFQNKSGDELAPSPSGYLNSRRIAQSSNLPAVDHRHKEHSFDTDSISVGPSKQRAGILPNPALDLSEPSPSTSNQSSSVIPFVYENTLDVLKYTKPEPGQEVLISDKLNLNTKISKSSEIIINLVCEGELPKLPKFHASVPTVLKCRTVPTRKGEEKYRETSKLIHAVILFGKLRTKYPDNPIKIDVKQTYKQKVDGQKKQKTVECYTAQKLFNSSNLAEKEVEYVINYVKTQSPGLDDENIRLLVIDEENHRSITKKLIQKIELHALNDIYIVSVGSRKSEDGGLLRKPSSHPKNIEFTCPHGKPGDNLTDCFLVHIITLLSTKTKFKLHIISGDKDFGVIQGNFDSDIRRHDPHSGVDAIWKEIQPQ